MATAELKAILTGQSAGFNKAMDGADAKMSSFEKRMKSMRGNMAAALGAGVVVGFTKSLVDMASNIKDTADNLSMTTDAIQSLTAKGREYGVENEKMIMALGKLRNAQGEVMKGSKTQTEALNALGISAEEFVGLSTDEAFARVGKAVLDSKNQMEAFNAVNEIFGERIGKNLIATLKDVGAVGMQSIIDKAKEAGQVIEESLIDRADKAGDRFTELWQMFKNGALVAIDFVRGGFEDLFMVVGILVDKGIGNLTRFADAVKGGNLREALAAIKAQMTGEGVGTEIQKQKNDRAAAEAQAREKKKADEVAAREQESQAAKAKFAENLAKKDQAEKDKIAKHEADIQAKYDADRYDNDIKKGDALIAKQNAEKKKKDEEAAKLKASLDEENFQYNQDKKDLLDPKRSEGIASGAIKADSIQQMGGQIGAAAVNLGPMEKQLRVEMEIRDLTKKHTDILNDIKRHVGGIPE